MANNGDPMTPNGQNDVSPPEIICAQCGRSFKTAQGLAGHERLAHSLVSPSDLAAQEWDLTVREEEVERRAQEIVSLGPRSLGLVHCSDCGGWLKNAEMRGHRRIVHPIEQAVANDAGVERQRVERVWTEACREAERRPDKSPEDVIKGFWLSKDREILRRLRERNAAFRFAKQEG